MPTLSIIRPVYSERSTFEAAIEDALGADLLVEARELIVVDDGSTDGTRELLRDGTWPDTVRVVFHDRNRGKGAAIRTGLQHATGDFAAILDADLEYAAADLGPVLGPCSPGAPQSSSAREPGRRSRPSASGTCWATMRSRSPRTCFTTAGSPT